MSDRYDIFVGGKEVARDTIRACPPVGSTVELADGSELEVVRVVYPVGRRVRLECRSIPKAAPKKIVEQPKQDEPAEDLAEAKNSVDSSRRRR